MSIFFFATARLTAPDYETMNNIDSMEIHRYIHWNLEHKIISENECVNRNVTFHSKLCTQIYCGVLKDTLPFIIHVDASRSVAVRPQRMQTL